jgi:preprotein translocase subunit SecA
VDTQTLEALELEEKNSDEIADTVWALIKTSYAEKETLVGADLLRRIERDIMLQIVDSQWKDTSTRSDHLKEGIGLRGYGQRDPLVEYKKESYGLFQDMKARIEEEMVRYLFWLRPVFGEGSDAGAALPPRPSPRRPPARERDDESSGRRARTSVRRCGNARSRHRPGRRRHRRAPAATM